MAPAAEVLIVVTDPDCTVVVRSSAEGIVVVSIAGEFDIAAVPGVTAAVRPHLHCDIHVDLDAVRFIDSSGLQCLLGLRAEAAEVGGRLRVGNVTPAVARLFELSGVTETLRSA
jgi:stage II sporulation protein AA (anti-sigma F factor antagonist)